MTNEAFYNKIRNIAPGVIAPGVFVELMILAGRVGEDAEDRHCHADLLLCEALKRLGYGDGVAAYDAIPKWYS